MPKRLRCLELQLLLNVTARGFGAAAKGIWFLPYERALREYAAFTADRENVDPARLRAAAFAAGRKIRRVTGLDDREDLERLIFALYRGIGITMTGRLPGEITVSSCYFGRFYTPERCALMSQADEGIIAGILGGGELTFTERISEGRRRCAACFEKGEERK